MSESVRVEVSAATSSSANLRKSGSGSLSSGVDSRSSYCKRTMRTMSVGDEDATHLARTGPVRPGGMYWFKLFYFLDTGDIFR